MEKKSLVKQFGLLFALIAVITIVISGAVTYMNQTQSYHREIIDGLFHVTKHLCNLISADEEEFIQLKKWYSEHPEQVQIPADFRGDLERSSAEFYKYALEHYGGRVPDTGLSYDEMDDEAMRLFAIYRFEYWFTVFFDTADEFGLRYVYFMYPEEGMDHTMNYMFDPSMTTEKGPDGKELLVLNEKVYEDPGLYAFMWEAWDTGKAPEFVDSVDSGYGYVYTYCQPLIINGEKIGLICADGSVDRINREIGASVARHMLITAALFILATMLLYFFLRKMLLDRLVVLQENVTRYSEEKKAAIADEIAADKGQDDELGALADRFSAMIVALDDYMKDLQRVTAEKERIGAELNVAARIQADMLPSTFPAFPDVPEIDLYATMDPAKEVGGDFYDFFMVDDRHIALVIADVSGKGVPAALFMVIAKTLIKNQALMGKAPSEVLANVNDQLSEGNDSCLFVTVWLAVIDLETGDALEANAGHENPAIKKADGRFEFIKTKHSPAVAMMEGMKFRQREFHLDPGDTLFVYTDGVPEATDASEKMFGEERLETVLNKNKDAGLEDLLHAVRENVDDFVGDAPQFDDITMLGFTYRGKEKN